jgi:uncharacterized protein YceK
MDLDMISECSKTVCSPEGRDNGMSPVGAAAMVLFCTADIPFSAIADTIMLPHYLREKNHSCPEEARRQNDTNPQTRAAK